MNSHWSIKFFKSDYLLIKIVESAIFLFDKFFTIKSFERIISLLKSSNRNLSLCVNNCTVKFSWFDHLYWDHRIKDFFFCQLIFFINHILESYDYFRLKIVEFANQIFFSFWSWLEHFFSIIKNFVSSLIIATIIARISSFVVNQIRDELFDIA
jgi:hypothetical protein